MNSVLASFLIVAALNGAARDAVTRDAVTGDAIAAPLGGQVGDPAKGELLMGQRHKSLCLLCHSGPFPEPHLHGTIAPDLTAVGARLSVGQIRLRIADMRHINPSSIMPSYYSVVGRANHDDSRVAAEWRDRPVLEANEIEDLIAYLVTLKK